MLRNGNLLEGQIVQAGDYFVVVLGTSEIKLPAKDVEAQVASRDEAYQLRKFGMFGQAHGKSKQQRLAALEQCKASEGKKGR